MKKVYELFTAGAGLAARGLLGVFPPSKMKKYVLGALAAATTAMLAVALMAGDLFPGAGDLKVTSKSTVGVKPLFSINLQGVHYYSSRFQCELWTDTLGKEDHMIDYKNGIFYTIDHKSKEVSKQTFDDMEKLLKWMGGAAPSAKTENVEIKKIEKVGKATIAGRTCDKYKITIGKNVSVYYLDPSLEDPLLKIRRDKMGKVGKAIFGEGELAKLQEGVAGKLKGFTLKIENENVKMDVTKVEIVPIPASMFELPKGYKVKDIGKEVLKAMQKM